MASRYIRYVHVDTDSRKPSFRPHQSHGWYGVYQSCGQAPVEGAVLVRVLFFHFHFTNYFIRSSRDKRHLNNKMWKNIRTLILCYFNSSNTSSQQEQSWRRKLGTEPHTCNSSIWGTERGGHVFLGARAIIVKSYKHMHMECNGTTCKVFWR